MYLKIQKLDNRLISDAKKYFNNEYISLLKYKTTFNESLVARYLISQKRWKYSCISHKNNLVFIGVSDIKVGVDIEKYKNRDESVLGIFSNMEYDLIWLKELNNFYLLWTAKESIIKLLDITLDDMKNIEAVNISKKNQKISDIIFNYESLFKYKDKIIKVLSWKDNKYIFSVCYF